MLHSDAPITEKAEDKLNRVSFTDQLANLIVDNSIKESFCIGLLGPWGSGKTSILNLTLQTIETINQEKETKPIVIQFNPWNFSSPDQIIEQYFVALYSELSTFKDKSLQTVASVLEEYAGTLDSLGPLGKLFSTLGTNAGHRLSLTGNLFKTKKKLIDLLSEQKRKIIVIIDDLDRLPNKEIRLIFQLITSVAKFPNTVYLLAFDQQTVSNALSEVQNIDGNRYIEKIIQLPINIPEPSQQDLLNVLTARLENLPSFNKITGSEAAWREAYNHFISPNIQTIRDITRLTNTMSIKCEAVGEEINLADLAALTVIEHKLPILYSWIKNNKVLLVDTPNSYYNPGKDKEQVRARYVGLLEESGVPHPDKSVELLETLFPFISRTTYGSTDDLASRKELRIGHTDHFDSYFTLEIPEASIPISQLKAVLRGDSEINSENFILNLQEKGLSASLLKEIKANLKLVPASNVFNLVLSLFNTVDEFVKREPTVNFGSSPVFLFNDLIEDLLMLLEDEEKRYNTLREVMTQANPESVLAYALFINSQEHAHGRFIEENNKQGKTVITLDHLIGCEQEFLNRIQQPTESHNPLLDSVRADFLIDLFERISPDRYQTHMKDLLALDSNKLTYGCLKYIRQWTGEEGFVWERIEVQDKILQLTDFKQIVKEAIDNKSLHTLSDNTIHRIVAFYLVEFEDARPHVPDKLVKSYIEKNNLL